MKDLKTILESKPRVKDYNCQPYEYINALRNYIGKLEKAINYNQCCKSDSDLLCRNCGSNDIYTCFLTDVKVCNKCHSQY